MAKKKASLPQETMLGWVERHYRACLIALLVLGTVRIALTYTVFSHTFDEPAHLACGMEWLDKHTYNWEPQHPPLSRVAVAMLPYLSGLRIPESLRRDLQLGSVFREGDTLLNTNREYDLHLALARAGVLPFFWLACLVVYWWGARCFSRATGVMAAALFSFLPPILAHAGLATTDIALAATLGASFLSGMIWLEEPTWKHAAVFSVASAAMVLSKFSCLVFFPAAAGLALAWWYAVERQPIGDVVRGLGVRLPQLGAAVLVALMIVWAGYRFSVGAVDFTSMKVPFPELFAGIKQVAKHNEGGHTGYLLGMRRTSGFWYFYEVALAVKTPLPFLALMAWGIGLACRKHEGLKRLYVPFCFSAAILVVGAFSRINIGIRHVLPIYLGFSILAAVALVRGLEMGSTRAWAPKLMGALLVWYAASSIFSHPDYLPYFNLLAGSQPEKILVDSDLDWGQDMKRAGLRLQEVHAPSVAFVTNEIVDLQGDFGFPTKTGFRPSVPGPGWNLVSKTMWKTARLGLYDSYPDAPLWPDQYMKEIGSPNVPQPERIGKGMLLWYIPPAQ